MQKRKYAPDGRRAAAALKYRMGEDSAPRLVARGSGKIAEKILEVALEAGVPVREDPDLLALLMTLDLDTVIPPELYAAVAETLVFVYRMNGKMGERNR